MLETIKNAFKTKEIRNKLLFVFFGLIIVRIGCNIPLPGVNTNVIQNLFDNNQALNFLDVMTLSLIHISGNSAQLMAKEGKYATLRMPSGEMRMVPINCRATIGQVGNSEHNLINIGKAGRKRHMGIRPKMCIRDRSRTERSF